MQIIYGCLAEDTLILMQDGTEKPINALTADEFVICGNNHPRRIENITTGRSSITLILPPATRRQVNIA